MQTYARTKYGCYLCSISLAALSALSPLLFMNRRKIPVFVVMDYLIAYPLASLTKCRMRAG